MRKNSNKNSSIKKPKPINATNKITYPEAYRNRLKARSNNQQKYIDDIIANHVTFAQGPAGSGKTLISVGMAIEYLLDDKVKKIIFTRPVVEVGASIGYLPGPQPLDAKILTPSGWVLMGNISIGDMVIGRDGLATKVLGVFPKGIKDVYRITTTDGRTTECCEDHLWLTQTSKDRKRNRAGSVKSTKEISISLLDNKNKINHSLPRNEPVHFKKQQLPISPYALGALLGDCSLSNNISFSNIDIDIIERVDKEMSLIKCYCVKESDNRISYNIRSNLYNNKTAKQVSIIDDNTGESTEYSSIGIAAKTLCLNTSTLHARCHRRSLIGGKQYKYEELNKKWNNPVKEILYRLGLLGKKAPNKYIPEIYKYSTIQDRLDLLRGLMDTDGTVKGRTGEASFCTTSKQLAMDVIELVQSLGGKAVLRHRNRVGKTSILKETNRIITARRISYEFTITLPNEMNPFYTSRKAKKYQNNFMHKIGISDIVKVGAKEVQCIRVENPEHLYITDDYIVTHNTAEEKLHPYLLPILDEIAYFISPAQYASLKLSNRIEVVPLNLMRGRTFNNCFIVCDESQNASYDQLKMLLTRIGKDSKMIINGDNMQSDLPRHAQGGLFTMTEQLCGIPGIGVSVLEISDIVRNPIISQIIIKLEEYEKQRTQ